MAYFSRHGLSVFIFILLSGCVSFGLRRSVSYDKRSVSIQTLSLFNQRQASRFSKNSWRGDWLFRRERIDIIDDELRIARPDLIVFQELMAKHGSSSESDQALLSFGALKGYDWDVFLNLQYTDTLEDESQGIAAGLPLKIVRDDSSTSERFWKIGADGFLALTVIELDEQRSFVFNIKMPSEDHLDVSYTHLTDIMLGIVGKNGICRSRIIVAGYLPGGSPLKEFSNFLHALGLKDAGYGRGKCEVQSDCYTGTSLNEIFMATSGTISPGQFDRILVHESAIINSTSVNYNTPAAKISEHAANFGLTSLWPTKRFGWASSIRLAQCR